MSHAPVDAQAVARQYLAAWNETDPAERQRLLRAIWTEDASFVDPVANVRGLSAIDGVIAAVQQKFPAMRFEVHGTPQAHNDRIRFSWALGGEGGAPAVIGTDIGVLAADGRMASVTGFFDQVNV